MAHAIIFYDFETPVVTRPVGPYAIASVLRQQGLDVLVVPHCASLSLRGVQQIIENNAKNLLWIGISTTFFKLNVYNRKDVQNYKNEWSTTSELTLSRPDFRINTDTYGHGNETLIWDQVELNLIAKWLDERFQCPLILGGANSPVDKFALHSNIHTVLGYAENYINELTKNLLEKKQDPIPFINNNSSYDNIDFKTSSVLWHSTDFIQPNEWLPLEVSRGCAFDCAYCSYDRKSTFDSYKTPDSLKQELIRNYETWGTTKYVLVDDLYNDSKEKVRVLYDQVWSKLPFKVEWVSYMRLDMFWSDPESIDIVKASGARAGGFGVETLHDQAGRKVGKGLGKKRILETLQNIKERWQGDVAVYAYMIAGLPHEPWDSILESWEWTKTTDLIHGSMWEALYVRPPDAIERIVPKSISRLDKNPGNFDLSWPTANTGWVNSMGVSKEQCVELVNQKPSYLFEFRFSFHNYSNLRFLGWDHQDLVNLKSGSISMQQIWQKKQLIINQNIDRISKLKS